MGEKRLMKELNNMMTKPESPYVNLKEQPTSINQWFIVLTFPEESIYHGQTFEMRFNFSAQYPIDAPEVIFVGENIPLHEHVYSNGHLCMDILYDKWSPALTVSSVCISIHSMFSSAPKEVLKRPPDNEKYVVHCNKTGQSPKQTRWAFHDDKA
eukprot:TRINITY_DN106021_c0_g1_i1.p1 TRINITY_DN106021_c0_g1~~TRINITY_DN106021_c0_g1_i1.p1  ORF type:complete len:154 (+),score=19.94 TRINITY_DN106021_c0_g1_i1:28-489(+)